MHAKELNRSPFEQFNIWFHNVTHADERDPHAFALATADKAGRPSVRTLLYKGFVEHEGERAFSFYSNICSEKGQDLAANPQAEAMFYWPQIYRQVRIYGDIVLLSREKTEEYFLSRSFASQASAMASKQSQVIANREELEKRVKEIEAEYRGDDIPCPSYWQGYGLVPKRFEFWLGRDHRLHDRFGYIKDEAGKWVLNRLAP